MRRIIFSTFVLTCLPLAAHAQNYIASNGYNGAGVVVNMDVLSGPSNGAAPVMSQNLPPLLPPPVMQRQQPIVLRPPQRQMQPMPATAPMPAPSYTPPVMSPAPPPVMPTAPKMNTYPSSSDAPVSPAETTPVPRNIAPVAPLVSNPILDQPTTPLAPVASKPVSIPPIISPAPVTSSPSSSKRQALGSLHDALSDDVLAQPSTTLPPPPKPLAPVDEMMPMPLTGNDTSNSELPAALPSPIMGNKQAIQNSVSAPAPVPAIVSEPKPTSMAPPIASAKAPVANADNFEAYRLFFDPSSDVLKPSETTVLDKVIAKLLAHPELRLQVRAYANGTADTAGAARRLSLSRSLKVRDYLMDKNVAAPRLDIRALGIGSMEMGDSISSGKAPPDRVDVIFAK